MKPALCLITLLLATLTYGGMYSYLQHTEGGYSYLKSTGNHLMALDWAIFPPMWLIAPFVTEGYKYGFQFHHHTLRPCERYEFDETCEKRSY